MFAKELVDWKFALSLSVRCLFRGEIPVSLVFSWSSAVQNKIDLKGVWTVYKRRMEVLRVSHLIVAVHHIESALDSFWSGKYLKHSSIPGADTQQMPWAEQDLST